MYMHFESFEENRADYCGSGYIPLYPLLNRYWDKPLAEMPQTLRFRVEKAVPSWDDIYRSCSIEHAPAQLTTTQVRIQLYDMQRDHTQERKTFIALKGYIRGGYTPNGYPSGKYVPEGEGFIRGQLPDRIDKIASNGMASVADTLREQVALPLEKICHEVGTHWTSTEPLLWKELCKFREMTLTGLLDKAKCEKNNDLATELGYVSTYIYRILNLERHHVDPEGEIESEWKANAAAQASPVFVRLKETNTEKPTPKQVREGDRKIGSERKADVVEQTTPDVMNTTCNLVPTNNWILKIQAEATRKWKDLVKIGCSPTRHNIKGDLAKWCRDNNVKTDGDIYPTDQYIYRHVLRKKIWRAPA